MCLEKTSGIEHQSDTPFSDHVMRQDANKQCQEQFFSLSEACKIKVFLWNLYQKV